MPATRRGTQHLDGKAGIAHGLADDLRMLPVTCLDTDTQLGILGWHVRQHAVMGDLDDVAAIIANHFRNAGKQARLIAEKTAFYRPQLADYRRAVAQLYGLPPHAITAELVFMRAGSIVPVEA